MSLGLMGTAAANTTAAEGTARPEAAAATAASHPLLAGSRLQGEAAFRFFGLRIYQARLWTMPGFDPDRPAAQPALLELTYQRELKGEAIADRSLNEMRRAGGFTEAQAERWLAQMRRIFPDVRDGDRLAGLHLPGEGARFWLNGRPAGAVADPEFSRLFFGIWLAPTTSEPALRLALLGRDKPAAR
jgi:hypothetical protein